MEVTDQSPLINPDVLRWARETAGLDLGEVARRLKRKTILASTIAAWENGEGEPTYAQLEALAYSIYGRPLAIFFFPNPPDEPSTDESFRTLPRVELERLSPRIQQLVRSARVLQLNVSELNDGQSRVASPIIKGLRFTPEQPITKMVAAVRDFLDTDVQTQQSWPGTKEAFSNWRMALEEAGICIFKDSFRLEDVSGFCLLNEEFPVIYVNNSQPATRQIFTLFHELAHLLFGTGGVDTRLDSYLQYLSGESRSIEVKCNEFAAEFLVPSRDFVVQSRGMGGSELEITRLARRYHVSREVILRKFLDAGVVSQRKYTLLVKKWADEVPDKRGGGGNYYWNKRAYLGSRYLELVFGKYYQGRISRDQLADYLGVKSKSVAGMETALLG